MKTYRINTIRIKVIALILIGLMFMAGTYFYENYQKEKLENGAYRFLNTELYGEYSNLDVLNVIPVDGGYDLEYTYEREDGHTIHGWHYGVDL